MTATMVGAAGTAGAPDARTIADRKLAQGAQEFEAMLLGEMMKPLKFGSETSADEDDDAGAAGTVRSLGTEAMAKAVAAGGGLGIAREVLRQVGAERDSHGRNVTATKV